MVRLSGGQGHRPRSHAFAGHPPDARALEELVVEGYPTGADLAHMILYHPDYLKGEYDTGFLEQESGEPAAAEPRGG